MSELRHDVGQVDQMRFFDLDQPQPFGAERMPRGLDQRGFARAARAGQQHIVGGFASDKLARVRQ